MDNSGRCPRCLGQLNSNGHCPWCHYDPNAKQIMSDRTNDITFKTVSTDCCQTNIKVYYQDDIDKLEQEIQQYKQQIEELEKEINRIWNLDEVDFYSEKYERFLSKLKERDEK